MPLHIIRQDITKMQVDAVVNPSNTLLFPSGGTDLAIHKAAGPELFEKCQKLGGCDVGFAKITPGFNLPCKYVIHTVGPVWKNEKESDKLLASCYENCLELAKENSCESLAFPLISSGTFGYPKDRVLKIAINTISAFLFDNEMTVYLLVYDKKSYELSEKLFSDIESYIDDNYVLCNSHNYKKRRSFLRHNDDDCSFALSRECMAAPCTLETCAATEVPGATKQKKSLDDFLKLDESFAQKLLKLIDSKGISDVECYKKANVSKQTWHKLMTDKHYKPNKKTAISFAVALELSLDETQRLLSSVGFVLSDSSLFDVIIKYCLENEIYNVFEIDSVLFKYDQETLFSKA